VSGSSSLGGSILSNRQKKWLLLIAMIGLVVFMSGCTQINEDITPESTGIWNTIFVYPMSWLITFFADIFSNYGVAIIVVTVLVRLLLVPLNVKQIKSQVAMQAIQPELKEIQKKYSSKDAATQKKSQEEQMALFQKYGVNPLAGCLPLIVQMPILIAMYHAVMRTPEILDGTFLWFELGDTNNIVLALIAGGATFLQQKLMMASQANANPSMSIMLYIMPIMLTIFAYFFPSALALYWVVGNVFMVVQTVLIRNPMMKDANNGGDTK